MTDLNSSLTDFDKSLIKEAPKAPEIKPFSVWSEENQVSEADAQSYVQYSDYLREDYLTQGAYTPNVENEISNSLKSKLADFGVVDEEDIQALTATKEPSFEEKLEHIRAVISSDEEDWKTLTDYKAGEQVVSAGGTVKPFQDKVAGLKERSEEIVNRRYNDVKRSLVESDQLPLAYVTNEEGQRELLVSDAAENMTVAQAIKASKLGGVSFKDGLVAQKLLSPVAGLDIKFYKFKKLTEISEGIAELAQQDASVAEHITGHTRQLARKDQNAFDSVGATISRGVSDLLTFAGVESEESNAEKRRIFLASHESFDNTVEYITEKLNASGANYSTKDVRDAYESHVINEGARRGAFKLHQDPSEAGKNLYKTALGPVLNPAVFAREEDMINTLAAHPELTAQQKELFTKNRVDVLKQNFASYSKLLSESAVGDEWTKALVAGRQAGREDIDIFDEFVAKDENFNEFTESVKGIAYSVWDSVASLLYIAPAVMGADWAKEGLAEASQRRSDRREVAQIFGEQYGLFQDVAESVAPLIVDVAATTALSTVSAGAGGAAYLTAKGGAQLTAKGLGKALTSNVLRATSKEGLDKVADTAIAKGLIKKSLEKGHRNKTIEALEAYNSEVARKFGVTVGTFVPAATRSSAMSYGSLYNQLRKDPNLTEEEAHDRALGFALTSGAITGVITSGFGLLGRGGVEDALLKGMTFRESKKLFEAMGNTTGIANETVAAAMKKVLGDSIKKYGTATLGKKVVKNAVDEGIEEGVDQLVNSFVEDVALNQDTPMLERMKQVWHAAQVGGILGGGVPAIQAAGSRLGVTPMDQLQQRIRMRNEFVEQVSSELEGTGSPLSAIQVREIMMSRVRDRRPSEPQPEAPDTLSITEQKIKSEQDAKRTQEIAQEISKLEDESTLPEEAEEREAEVARRAQRREELDKEGMALLEEQQNLRALEQAPTTPDISADEQTVTPEVFIQSLNEASPLDVETAFENIRNQQNIAFNNSEDTTVLKIEDTEAPPTSETPFDFGPKIPREIKDYSGRADIDFTNEQANAESVGVSLQGESRINIGSHNSNSRGFDPSTSKRYSSRPSPNTLRVDDPPFSGENVEEKALKFIDFAIANGFPVNLDPNVNYGLPIPSKASRQSISEFVSSAVYTAYPKIAPPKNAKPYVSKQAAKTYFDPVSGKTVRQKVKGFVDENGNGIFDNDPIVMIDMLKSGKLVRVPRNFGKANINPSIRIKDGVVVDVVGPTADGNLLESKVVDARHVSPIEPNNTRASVMASIPFRKAELPAGVKDFDPLNGGPLSEDFTDTTTIKRRIARFSLELEKTGEEANRRVQSRLESNSGELSPEFRMAALESAKQEFLFNAQLISLREKFLANPATIIDEVVTQTGSSNVDQAAQRLLPFIKVEFNTNLTGSAILGLFVEQKLQNNPDFANNAPPTFDTLLAKAANRFKSQEETATSLRQQRAVATLPFDRTPSEFKNPKVSEWIANFGRNPEGELASPEDISNAVSDAIDTAIDAVNTDPDLRRAINKITLDHVLNDGTPEMNDMVQTASARDIFGLFASWMSSGNGNTRESVTEFVEQLELGAYPSSSEFQNALLLVNLATRSDGASYENSDAVNAYRDLFNEGAGQEIDTDQARNTMIALTKAVRTHLSRSNISSAERSAVTAQNESDIQRLELESGNPESVIKALKEVSKNSDNPSHKVVADLLLLDTDFIKKVKFVLGSATADIAGKYVKGLDGSHTVFINKTSGNGRGLVNTLLEEYVHAFVSDVTSATEAQIESMPRGTKTRLKALNTVLTNSRTAYANQKKVSGPVPALENALVDLNEFTAQFLLSEDVQKHVRSLVPPPNRSSFFSRFLTNLVMLFPKAGAKDIKGAVNALEDVLDVGSNTRKTAPTDPKVFGGSLAGKALFSSPSTIDGEPLTDLELQLEKNRQEAKELRADLQRETEDARLEAKRQEEDALREAFLARVPEAAQPKMSNLLNYVRGLIPLGMDMKITTESGGSSAFVTSDSSDIFINPIVMLNQVGDISDTAGRAMIGTIINEELSHTASFNALSVEEVQEYIDSLSESDFVDIAKEYHVGNDAALNATLAQLNSDDSSVVADARYRMAEEKLRMHLQKVTRGFTTEDDIQFWKSKPSLLGMLGRYFRGIINRWVAKRKQIGPAADVALNKLIIEMRAIEAGFVRQPTKMSFDPETPMDVFRMFGTVNQNFVALASAAIPNDPTAIPIELNKKGDPISQSYSLLKSPMILEPSGDGRKDIEAFDFDSLHYKVTGPARKRISEAIESGAVGEATDRLVEEVNEMIKDPSIKAGIGWYSRMRVVLKNALGDRFKLFTHLLGATSAQTPVETNFIYSMEALTKLENGDYDSNIKSYLELRSIAPENLRAEIESRGFASASQLNEATTPAKLTRLWLDHYKILPTRDNGNLYGANSLAALKAMTDTWLQGKLTPKTPQFAMNLNGDSLEATIDVWAARTLRRILWGDRVENWRIQPKAETGVSNEDFALGQIIFREAAKTLKMSPDDLQALVWFGEKDVWDKNRWTKEVGAFKSSFDEAAAVFFPPNEPPRPLEHGKNIIKFLQKERLMLSKLDVFEDNSPQLKKAKKEYEEAKRLEGVGPYLESRGREPVAESRAAISQRDVSDERDGRTDRSGSEGDLRGGEEQARPITLGSAPAAAPSGQPTGTGIDFSAVVDLLEVPVYENETGRPQNFIMEFLTNMFAGELPEAFRRLVQNRDAYKRLTESNVIAYKNEMDKLIKDTYGSYENAPMEMIARAQGYYSGNVVTEQVLNKIEETYDKAHAKIEADRKAGNITKGEADTLKSIADKIRTNDTNKAYDAAVKVREADRDAALRDLAKESPKLAAHIIDVREKLIIPLQKKLVNSGLDSKIGIKISKTGGIYVTRSYRMFTDSSYLETVKTDPNYQKVRDAAMKFFEDEFLKKTTSDLVDGGMDASLAKIEAKKILDRESQSSPHNSYGQEALNAFLMQYEKGGKDSTTLGPKDYKMIEDNLKRRRDLPKEIRELLGELGPESGIDLILRTYSTVATLASQQAFLNQLKKFGVDSGVMVTTEEASATKDSRAKYADFVPARSGVPSKNDPLSGMRVSPEFKKALDVTLKDSYVMDYADTAEKAVKGIFGLAANLSGKAMAAKTLGSIGFYGRNAIGNLLFGTSQGFFRYDKMIAAMTKSSKAAFTDPNKIDPVVSELIGLNIMGDELRAGVMRDLLNGKVTPEGIRKQITELGEKTKISKLTKGLAIVEKKAQDLSAALDAAYKVAYYNHELNILKEAQAADTSTVEDGKVRVNNLAAMSDTKIKRLAARKVVMTSQAYSQAPPAVAAFTKSGLGLVFAPFIRFKMEVPRIVINTFKLAKEEIDSGNPVLVRRGRLRMGSMIGTLGVLSSALPMVMAALSGIGDEEDEAMRASIPDYLRGHTFFYFGQGKNLKSIDLTYVNPYSLIVDPFLRAYENIRRGEFTEAGAALAIGFVRDQYLDDQILSGAVRDATRNVNPSTGKPIWNNGADGPVEAGSKILSYIAKEAYAPRIGKDFVNGWATGSLSGMVGEIMDGAMPARIHDVDLQKQYSRYLLDLNKRFNNVKSGLNAVKRNVPMSDEEVADIIDDNIEDRRLLNYELMRINKGFSSLGLTDTDLLKGMKEMKLGRDRVALLSRGYMDRPSPKYIIESLLDPRTEEYGEGRAQQILNHYQNINRYIPVRPITESE